MSDKLSAERRSENMRRIRSKHTSPEMKVRRLVHSMGFRYRLHVPNLPGKPDLVFPRPMKIIEVRGCFWHQHKGCIDSRIPGSRSGYWKPKLEGNVNRDRKNTKALKKLGWKILAIWECELKEAADVQQRIRAFLDT